MSVATYESLLQFNRVQSTPTSSPQNGASPPAQEKQASRLTVDLSQTGAKVPATILGSFLEHLAFSMTSGLPAQLLINPTFAREYNLTPRQIDELVTNGQLLVRLYLSGGDPAVLRHGWSFIPLQTGFGIGVLDEPSKNGVPLGWGALGYPRAALPAGGRVGDAVRLYGGEWPTGSDAGWQNVDDGPAGIRQGLFLPIRRCRGYHGALWVRPATLDPNARGELAIGLRRRVATPNGSRHAGETLASVRVEVSGVEWVKIPFALLLQEGQVSFGEPVDFTVRWLPRSDSKLTMLLDRAELYPDDEDDGLDPEVVKLAREWPVPLLRWPGGNFVSHYHWRDGIGPADLRPTRPNYAWGGLDDNRFGTDEFIQFCRKIGAEPHIAVNSGTGSAEEAAAWVEYCNGDVTTPMGKLRAQNGHPEVYNVKLWEVGNENFGSWQGGYHGSDENARRFAEFAPLMRAASPIEIELIATGNAFDFIEPERNYNHVQADGRWHDQLLKQAPEQIDYIALHALPVNDVYVENLSDEEAHNAILAQVISWERQSIPDLLAKCDQATQRSKPYHIRLAITEWGPLGVHPNRLMVENFGAVVYVGSFLNMMIRNSSRVPIANTTGFMHGGCIRKAYGVVYYDPQYLAVQQFAPFIGKVPVACQLRGPGYDVSKTADLGTVVEDIPWIDAVVCKEEKGTGLVAAIVNRSLHETLQVDVEIPGYTLPAEVEVNTMAHPDITARATPVHFEHFHAQPSHLKPNADGTLSLQLPPFSTTWLKL